MSVIDLGVVTVGPTATRSPAQPPRRPMRIRAFLVVIAVLATVGAAVSVQQGPLVELGRIPFAASAHLLVESHVAVVLDNDGRDRISAYDLVTGRRMWTQAAAGTAFNSDMIATPNTVIATLPQRRGDNNEIVAYDLRTGVVRWQRPGSTAQLVPGGLLISSGIVESLVDPDRGTAAWAFTDAPSCVATVAGRLLLDFCVQTGTLSVRDLHTGRALADRQLEALPVQGSTDAQVPAARLLYAGRITLIGFANGTQMNVAAYRTEDLTTIWSGLGRHPSDSPTPCGADICLGGAGDNEIVVDPGTGEKLNHAPTPSATQLSPNELLLVPTDVDYQTMRLGDIPLADRPTPAGATAQFVDTAFGSIWIASPSASSVRLVQHLGHVETAACMSIADYIACPRSHGELTFWRRSLT